TALSPCSSLARIASRYGAQALASRGGVRLAPSRGLPGGRPQDPPEASFAPDPVGAAAPGPMGAAASDPMGALPAVAGFGSGARAWRTYLPTVSRSTPRARAI